MTSRNKEAVVTTDSPGHDKVGQPVQETEQENQKDAIIPKDSPAVMTNNHPTTTTTTTTTTEPTTTDNKATNKTTQPATQPAGIPVNPKTPVTTTTDGEATNKAAQAVVPPMDIHELTNATTDNNDNSTSNKSTKPVDPSPTHPRTERPKRQASLNRIRISHTDSSWLSWWELLREYKDEKGHASPISHEVFHEKSLGRWVSYQRSLYRKLKKGEKTKGGSAPMEDWQLAKLKELDFVFEPRGSQSTAAPMMEDTPAITPQPLNEEATAASGNAKDWSDWLALLTEFKQEKGHICPTTKEVYKGKQLGTWANGQRTLYRKRMAGMSGRMTDERISKLNAIGFVWEPRKVGGNLRDSPQSKPGLRSSATAGSKAAAVCVTETDTEKKSDHQEQHPLFKHGESPDARWMAWYGLLKEFIKETGHANPSSRDQYQGRNLGEWVGKQRRYKRKKLAGQPTRICDARIEKLNQLGCFVWEPSKSTPSVPAPGAVVNQKTPKKPSPNQKTPKKPSPSPRKLSLRPRKRKGQSDAVSEDDKVTISKEDFDRFQQLLVEQQAWRERQEAEKKQQQREDNAFAHIMARLSKLEESSSSQREQQDKEQKKRSKMLARTRRKEMLETELLISSMRARKLSALAKQKEEEELVDRPLKKLRKGRS